MIYIILFQLILMPIAGILTAASWACAFFPSAFYLGPIGQPWMKMLGTTNVTIARFVTILVAILGVVLAVFFIICIVTGHV